MWAPGAGVHNFGACLGTLSDRHSGIDIAPQHSPTRVLRPDPQCNPIGPRSIPFMNKRHALSTLAALVAFAALGSVAHAETPIKFQLDWRFEGPAALFLQSEAKGYFKAAGLDVTVDSGNGSGGTVTRVASGTYDMGFADMAALMEFHANNPDAPNKPVAVMMVYNNTPAAVMALEEKRHHQARRPERQEAGRAGVRRGPQSIPDFPESQQRDQRGLDLDGPAAARNHAGAR